MSVAGVVTAALLLIGSDPYERTRVNQNDPGSHCLYWPAGTVNYYQSQNGDPDLGGAEFGAISRSFQSWQQILSSCGNLVLAEGPHVADRTIGYDQKNLANNKNLILFRMQSCQTIVSSTDACWKDQTCGNKYDCWSYSPGTIALTTTTFDTKTGRLYDADIELDGAYFIFTTVDTPKCQANPPPTANDCVNNDIQNTITHEAGHFIGLDHTTYPGSVMNPTAPIGELSKRTIDPGSAAFVCAVYPKGSASQSCDVSPLTAQLGPVSSGCGASGASPWPWAAGAGLIGLWLSRGRRRGGVGRAG